MFSRCVVVKTCAKYEEIKKRDLFLFFFSLSSVFERFLLSETKKKLERGFFLVGRKSKRKKKRRKNTRKLSRHYSHTHTHLQSCLLLLNKSRPSPASRPPRSKYVRLVRFFAFPLWRLKTRSLSLFFALVETPRVTFGFWILRIISLRYGKRSHRARCVSRGVLTDPTSIDRAREERKREHHHRRAQSFFARMNEPLPGAIDHPESTRPDRCERAERFWKKTFSSLESFFDFLLFFSKTSKFLYF